MNLGERARGWRRQGRFCLATGGHEAWWEAAVCSSGVPAEARNCGSFPARPAATPAALLGAEAKPPLSRAAGRAGSGAAMLLAWGTPARYSCSSAEGQLINEEKSSPCTSLGQWGLPTAGLGGLTSISSLYSTREGNRALPCQSPWRAPPWNLTHRSLPGVRRAALRVQKYSVSLCPEKWQHPRQVMGKHCWKPHPNFSWTSAFLCTVSNLLLLRQV